MGFKKKFDKRKFGIYLGFTSVMDPFYNDYDALNPPNVITGEEMP